MCKQCAFKATRMLMKNIPSWTSSSVTCLLLTRKSVWNNNRKFFLREKSFPKRCKDLWNIRNAFHRFPRRKPLVGKFKIFPGVFKSKLPTENNFPNEKNLINILVWPALVLQIIYLSWIRNHAWKFPDQTIYKINPIPRSTKSSSATG